jgi:hypothetical protein
MLPGLVISAPDGVRGFDTASTVTARAAAAFHNKGFRFCVRYVRRDRPHSSALSVTEARALLNAGLGIMAVQYVESESSWNPSAAKGSRNGGIAASEAEKLGLPWGVTVWCDLEGVARGTPRRKKSSTTAIAGTRQSAARVTSQGSMSAGTLGSAEYNYIDRCDSLTTGAHTT